MITQDDIDAFKQDSAGQKEWVVSSVNIRDYFENLSNMIGTMSIQMITVFTNVGVMLSLHYYEPLVRTLHIKRCINNLQNGCVKNESVQRLWSF